MALAPDTPPGVIESTIKYYLERPAGAEPVVYSTRTAGAIRMPGDKRTVQVTDVQAVSNPFLLDVNGFQFLKYDGQVGKSYESFETDEKIKKDYYDEATQLLKSATGATFVHVMGHTVRRDSYQAALDDISKKSDGEMINVVPPAMFAHVDQSYRGAYQLLDILQEPAGDDLRRRAARSRWAIINIWKPLKKITREPLAVCDALTVSEDDLRAVPLTAPKQMQHPFKRLHPGNTAFESWFLAANERHRWYYRKGMGPDEALLIKCFDSRIHDGTARRAPHSAIQTPHDFGPARESIELRCVAFWDSQAKL